MTKLLITAKKKGNKMVHTIQALVNIIVDNKNPNRCDNQCPWLSYSDADEVYICELFDFKQLIDDCERVDECRNATIVTSNDIYKKGE
jgi:hypothetical protein